jgi:hypothetical protein
MQFVRKKEFKPFFNDYISLLFSALGHPKNYFAQTHLTTIS